MNDYDPLFSHASETTNASDPQTTATTDLFFSATTTQQTSGGHSAE
ncbi:hypothetical protein [Gordonia aquimaris]|uniref:Uncharacterized protein n=1 Tax=Gordonia aquimaris TaxID=2984863 RepID=A0A9X3D2H8_9ACTN|nr:hypothetical protein [Gordonia aquimaris]MCX2963591.1 hypothetical protein [Gordonia aquimaris]